MSKIILLAFMAIPFQAHAETVSCTLYTAANSYYSFSIEQETIATSNWSIERISLNGTSDDPLITDTKMALTGFRYSTPLTINKDSYSIKTIDTADSKVEEFYEGCTTTTSFGKPADESFFQYSVTHRIALTNNDVATTTTGAAKCTYYAVRPYDPNCTEVPGYDGH